MDVINRNSPYLDIFVKDCRVQGDDAVNDLIEAINKVRSMFDIVRNDIKDTATNIYGRSLNFTIPIVENTINARTMMSKAHGILTTAVYTVFGSFSLNYLKLTHSPLFRAPEPCAWAQWGDSILLLCRV